MTHRRILMVLLIAAAVCVMGAGVVAATTITVDDSGGAMYASIQAAIDDASPGDEIHVNSGTYDGNVVVNKQLILRGMDTGDGMPVVDAGGSYDYGIVLSVDGIILEGFKTINATGVGITIESSNNMLANNFAINNDEGISIEDYEGGGNNNILANNFVINNSFSGINVDGYNNIVTDNIVEDNFIGIRLTDSTYNIIKNNNVSNNVEGGIELLRSDNNIISGNIANGNKYGIKIMGSDNTLTNNSMNGNVYNFYLPFNQHDVESASKNKIGTNNFVDGKLIYYLENVSNVIIDSSLNVGSLYCINCQNVTIKDLKLNNNYAGIFLYNTTDSIIDNVAIQKNVYGIYAVSSRNNTIVRSIVTYNGRYRRLSASNFEGVGIGFLLGNKNTIADNTVNNNYAGIYVDSDNSTIISNSLINNRHYGIELHSSNNIITNNNVRDGVYGISGVLDNSNTIVNNNIIGNILGIGLRNSNNDTIINNNISNNDYAIRHNKNSYPRPGRNTIYLNTFIGNDVHDPLGINIWESPQPIAYIYDGSVHISRLGNYWGDYIVLDVESGSNQDQPGSDGIGDTPYPIPGGSSVDNYPLMAAYSPTPPPSGFTVGQGAPTPAIEQLFIAAYDRNGGVGVLGEPESDVHEAFGLYQVQNFPGVSGIPGGVLMYNSIQNKVFYIHGAIWERYNIYQDKAKLGPVKEDEKNAAPSHDGTTGRYSKFETGTIHWISNKTGENENNPNRGKSFVTYGNLDKLYTDMGGTYNNLLGFPIMDQEVRGGYGFCEFEGGSIAWDGNEYKVILMSLSFKKSISPSQAFSTKYPSEVFTTGDLKYSTLNIKGNGFAVKTYATVILPDNTIKYAYQDAMPFCFGPSLESISCSLSPLLLSDVKRPLVEDLEWAIGDTDFVWNANEITGDESSGLYSWKVWYEDVNKPGKILVSSTASYTVSYSRQELMELLIQDETNDRFTVTIEGQKYAVANLSHYIDPHTLKLSETPEVKVYVDMTGKPVSDSEISRKIGVVDYIHKLQKNGLKDQLSQKQDMSLFKIEYTGDLPFWDWVVDTTETIIQLPTRVMEELIKSVIKEVAVFTIDNFFNNKVELTDEAMQKFLDASQHYIKAWGEIHNGADVLDYEKANVVLQNKLLGDFNFGMGQYILDQYYKPKGNPLIFEMREAAKIASLGTTEEIIAAAISVEYVSVSHNKNGITQCDISKKQYEFTPYTLQLAQSSPTSNEYESCILKINEETNQIKQDVSDTFTQQITFGILHSPAELRIYDSQNRVTGLIDNQIIEEIPNSAYVSEDETVIIYDAIDTYRYEVEGKEFGTYGLDLISFNDLDTISAFNAFDIPTSPSQNHQYNINWDILFNNQNGVSIQIDSDADGVFEQTIITNNVFRIYNITFLPPITTMYQFNLTSGSTLPIKFTVNHHITNEFIYDDTVNVTITNSTGHLVTYFTNGTGTDSVRINTEEEQYIVNFHSKNYDLNVGETYTVTVTFGGQDSLTGYDMTYFNLVEGGKAKSKNK